MVGKMYIVHNVFTCTTHSQILCGHPLRNSQRVYDRGVEIVIFSRSAGINLQFFVKFIVSSVAPQFHLIKIIKAQVNVFHSICMYIMQLERYNIENKLKQTLSVLIGVSQRSQVEVIQFESCRYYFTRYMALLSNKQRPSNKI